MPENTRFFRTINYASFHEDGNSERRALDLQGSDRVLCLTGSGARAFDLALDGPAEIVAIDWNPAQNFLLELKMAVVRRLDYRQGLEFLGLRPSTKRETTYAAIRDDLSTAAREFWDRRDASIRRGVFFDGRWEKFLRLISRAARWTRRGLLDRVLNAEDVEAQHALWRDEWDDRWWRTFLSMATQRLVVRCLLREPGLDYIAPGTSIGNYLRQRFEQASANFLFRESPWVWALAKGRIDDNGPMPEHLKPENFEALRERLDTISIVTASLNDYLRDGDLLFNAFSLSDFSSYCDQDSYREIWNALLHRASAGARFCERRFLVQYPLPPAVQTALSVDESLGETLNRQDRSVVYSFLVAHLASSQHV